MKKPQWQVRTSFSSARSVAVDGVPLTAFDIGRLMSSFPYTEELMVVAAGCILKHCPRIALVFMGLDVPFVGRTRSMINSWPRDADQVLVIAQRSRHFSTLHITAGDDGLPVLKLYDGRAQDGHAALVEAMVQRLVKEFMKVSAMKKVQDWHPPTVIQDTDELLRAAVALPNPILTPSFPRQVE